MPFVFIQLKWKKINYQKRGKKILKFGLEKTKEVLLNFFKAIAAFSFNKKLQIKKVGNRRQN